MIFKTFKIAIFSLLTTGVIFAQKYDKKFSENFITNKDVVVNINASNADIDVTTWNKNQVSVEAVIEVEGLDKKAAEKYFKNWQFEALGNKNKVQINANTNNFHSFDNNNFVFFNSSKNNLPKVYQYGTNDNVIVIPDIPEMPEIEIPEINFEEIVTGLESIEFDFDKYTKDGKNYFFQWKDGVNDITIKSKKEWEKFKKTKKYKKFKKAQEKRLLEWSNNLVKTLNDRFSKYEIDGLRAELEEDSRGEKIDIHYPKIAQVEKPYQLDHVLLEFGGRNRGKPTEKHNVNTYLSEITELNALKLPEATVEAFDPQFILWEKLTALHQFSTQEVIKNPARLARHWYDVDCLLELEIVDPFSSFEAMNEVVLMKQHRWSQKGVDYEEVLSGNLRLIPEEERLETITQDHQTSVEGGLFVKDPPKFDDIINRLKEIEGRINETTKKAL